MQIAGVTDRGTHWRNRVLRLGARILCMATVRRHTVDGRVLLPVIVRSFALIECINKPAGTAVSHQSLLTVPVVLLSTQLRNLSEICVIHSLRIESLSNARAA